MSNSWISPVIEYYKIFFGDAADIVIDVGTRDGNDAALIQQSLNTKSVYAIDAREQASEETKRLHPDFNVFCTAISDFNGSTSFYSVVSDDPDYAGSSSIYNKKLRRKEYKYTKIQVPVQTMDSFIEENGLAYKYLDIVKVDIEGYTFQFLQGFKKHLDNVKLFHLETEKNPTHGKHGNSEKIIEYLSSKNFILVATQHEWDDEIQDQIWVNKYLINDLTEKSKWRIS